MKEGWESTKLANVANCQIGLTYKPTDVVDEGGTIVLRSSNIQDSKIVFDDIVRVSCNIPSNKFVKDGDILMCSRNGSFRLVGKVAKIENLVEPMSYGAFMTIIRSDYNDFLYYYFQSQSFRKQIFIGQTATINQITTKMLNNASVVIPSISQQQQIVKELGLLSSIIEKKKAQLNELDNLAQSLFHEMFGDPIINEKGWRTKMLGEISNYSKTRITANELTVKNYVGVENLLQKCEGKVDAVKVPDGMGLTEYLKDDVLIGNIRPYLRKIWLATYRGGCNGDVLVIRRLPLYLNTVNPIYLFKCLSDDAFFDFDMQYSKGEKMPRGDKKEIMKYPICIPPIDMQNQFAEKVQAIEHQKELIRKSLKEVETLFNSRMDYYFN